MPRVLSAAAVLSVVISLATVVAAAPPPVAVTVCGQEVPRHAVGYLTGDLDCTGFDGGYFPGLAVMLHDGATLDLRGFTLTGGRYGVGCFEPCQEGAAYCNTRSCRIVGGGGAIVDTESQAVTGGRKLRVQGTTFSGHGDIVFHNFVDVRLEDVTLTNNGRMLYAVDEARLYGSTATGNASGLAAKRIRLFGSTVVGNGAYDLSTVKKPILRKGSTCGVSRDPDGASWGVCTED